MRLRTYNSRRKRLNCVKKDPVVRTFCYVVYLGRKYVAPVKDALGHTIDYEVKRHCVNRQFANYGEAIAHLTRVKLAIDEEDYEWSTGTPCKIVEGCYTKSGKEIITKEVRLNNECDRPPERHFGSGLSRQQQFRARMLARRYGVPIQQAMDFIAGRTTGLGWSSGTTTSCSSTTAMDLARMRARQISDPDRRYSATTN